eukprot:m.569552 g.569552  ORF g.569552 m.569552 type:complete len:153 (-) comp57840_c0_seq43:260-718(-)
MQQSFSARSRDGQVGPRAGKQVKAPEMSSRYCFHDSRPTVMITRIELTRKNFKTQQVLQHDSPTQSGSRHQEMADLPEEVESGEERKRMIARRSEQSESSEQDSSPQLAADRLAVCHPPQPLRTALTAERSQFQVADLRQPQRAFRSNESAP